MPTSLDHLRRATAARKSIDGLIAQLRVEGHPWEEIAEAADMSVNAAIKAARRGNGGVLPKPDPEKLRPGARLVG